MKSFVVDASDNRMLYVSAALKDAGYNVYGYRDYDVTDSVIYVFSPARRFRDEELLCLNPDSLIYCGNLDEHKVDLLRERNIVHINLLKDEIYSFENAIYTAEAALMTIIRNTPRSVYDSKMLILGYGRVGKAMSKILSDLKINFAVSARNYYERASAFLVTDDVRELNCNFDGIDVIINTIPAEIITEDKVRNINRDCYILDLASLGVIDVKDVEKYGLNYDFESGLPGRFVPESAGKSMAKAILRTIDQ